MIDKQGITYVPICDVCGEEMQGTKYYDFYDAVNGKKANGWKSKREDDEWLDVCPDCQGL